MATPALQKWRYAQKAESELKALMNGQTLPLYQDIEHIINEMRIACEATIFLDFAYAVTVGVGQRLWDAHVLINNRYRKMLEGFRKPDKKQKVIERRAVEKHYVDFIKTSQFFYKGYIQRLASHFTGMKGLRRIARCLSLQTLTVDNRVKVTPEVEEMIEASCHASLLRLGDLSRYRNQVRSKDRSWEPAMGYYALANDLCPDKGSAHNQMAVIALADNNHLDAVYHLFRAITVKEAHPLARNNLDIEFKKVTSAWKNRQGKTDSLSMLVWWFVVLQAGYHEGKEFSTREELEKEVLSRLALLLKEQSFGAILEKIVIVSIAAEAYADEKASEQSGNATPEARNSYFFCLEFNVRIMLVLLQVISPEFDQDHNAEELPKEASDEKTDKPRDKITAVARRVLPALRQYNTWLAGARFVISTISNPAVRLHIREMWNMYAIVLTKLVNFFPVTELPMVNYLLEEDESTIGFEPLRNPSLPAECDLFTDAFGVAKVRSTDPGVERHHPNVEMQSRIRDILLAAVYLEGQKDIPITLQPSHGLHIFAYNEEVIPFTSPRTNASPQRPEKPMSAFGLTPTSGTFSPEKISDRSSNDRPLEDSVSASDSMENDLSAMVDALVEPTSYVPTARNETSYGMHTLTANEIFAPIVSHSFEPRMQGTPKMLPSLTGLYNSAFTPQAHELQPTSPNRPNTARQLSPLSLSTRENRLAAAAALEEMTGYSTSKSSSGSWGRSSSRPLSGSLQQPVNQMIQESLAQQFNSSSSAFADNSSVYGGTPHNHNRLSEGFSNPFAAANGNSTIYPGASDFDRTTMLQSSIWANGRPGWSQYAQTPPGGQGG